MIGSSLSLVLSQMDAESSCLLHGDQVITTGELLDMAEHFRQTSNLPEGCRVALSGLGSLELIITLVALDGFAETLLLLPASVPAEHASSLVTGAACSHKVIAGNVETLTSSKESDRASTEQTSWLLATSGTTGLPKLIEHSFSTLTRTVKKNHKQTIEYIWGLVYDPSRFAGLQVVLQALLSGSQLSVPKGDTFEQQRKALLQHRVNALSATPSLWRKLLMGGGIANLPLRQVTLGGETADQSILNALTKTFPNARVVHIYASTEAGVGFAVQDGLAGFPASWLQDPPSFIPPLRISESNHLLIKPTMVAKGAEVASRMAVDGYFDTEDLVRQEGGRVYFLGRASGAINVGGNKVNPEEVEAFLRTLDDVQDARVFAKKSSVLGQLVVAEIVAASTTCQETLKQDIRQHCRNHLEPWQVPAMLKLVDALAETAAGKRLRVS